MYKLYIGNRNYSSWSLRSWVLLKGLQIPFEAVDVALAAGGPSEKHQAYSPSGLVPALHDGDWVVWDTLAITEYLAERHAGVWPLDPQARSFARSVSAEMHSGFSALRSSCPMNVKARYRGAPLPEKVLKDVQRIDAIWTQARERYGHSGDFLLGAFSAADAMFAPIAWRFRSYAVCDQFGLSDASIAWLRALLAFAPMREWHETALAETTPMPYDSLSENFGGHVEDGHPDPLWV